MTLIAFAFWAKHKFNEAPSRASIEEAVSHISVMDGDGKVHGLNERPFVLPSGNSEVAYVSGIEFKVRTAADGSKTYDGPLGAILVRAPDGSPIQAYIDEAWKAELEARKKISAENIQRVLEERRRAGK